MKTNHAIALVKPGSQLAVDDAVQGGALYAADASARDNFFAAGVFKHQQIYVAGVGIYYILQDYMGPFSMSTPGQHYVLTPFTTVQLYGHTA